MNVPLSVVIPVYNAEDYLQMSVGAILSQTFSNFELILVDDGSTDRS
ncbi:MAG: glycosyltransferase, partial [Oscillospiraceae bacterium]|nr:glycosyltransferase [Oscillospiraceae bacterium]